MSKDTNLPPLPGSTQAFSLTGSIYTAEDMREYARAALAQRADEPVALSASEAVYGFASWLTCRAEPVTFGSTNGAALPAELVDAFCKSQDLEPPREQWADGLKPYPAALASPTSPHTGDLVAYPNPDMIVRLYGTAAQAAPATQSPEAEAEAFIQTAISNAPEPLRELGEFLSRLLNEDQWPTAERYLLAIAAQPAARQPVGEWPTIRAIGNTSANWQFAADSQPVSGASDPVGIPAGEQTGPVSGAPTSQRADEPVEMSPEFTDTARAALLWVLWHHQGGSSAVGQPLRFALGMGEHDRMNAHQVAEAKRWGELSKSSTTDFRAAAPAAPAYVPLSEFERMQAIGDEFPIALVQPIIIQKVDSVCRAIESLVVARMLGEGQ